MYLPLFMVTIVTVTGSNRNLLLQLVTSDVLKRKTDGSEDEVVSYDSKKQKIDIPISEQVLMSTIPYHSLSYSEQVSSFCVCFMSI